MTGRRRLTIARLMRIVLGTAVSCSIVRSLSGFPLVLLFLGVLTALLMWLYLCGIFKFVRWVGVLSSIESQPRPAPSASN
jgi:hypothetical protein